MHQDMYSPFHEASDLLFRPIDLQLSPLDWYTLIGSVVEYADSAGKVTRFKIEAAEKIDGQWRLRAAAIDPAPAKFTAVVVKS